MLSARSAASFGYVCRFFAFEPLRIGLLSIVVHASSLTAIAVRCVCLSPVGRRIVSEAGVARTPMQHFARGAGAGVVNAGPIRRVQRIVWTVPDIVTAVDRIPDLGWLRWNWIGNMVLQIKRRHAGDE